MDALRCADPIPLPTLLEYWLGELDEARELAIDEHLLGCAHCTANLQALADIGDGIRMAVGAGDVNTVVTGPFVERLAARGLRLRQYRVPHNGSVHCTVAPDDDLLITRLVAPLDDVEHLDIERLTEDGVAVERVRDVPFDASAGEVLFTPRIARIRALPRTTVRFRLVSTDAAGDRIVGDYTLYHTPHPAA